MATIRKRGDRWQAQVRRQGQAVSRSFMTKADALSWARQTELEIERTGLPSETKAKTEMPLSDLLRRYRDEVVVNKRSGKNETAVINAFLRHKLASVSLGKLKASDFTAYRDERLTTVKPATVRREFVILRHCLQVAITEWSIPITENPLHKVKLPPDSVPRDRRLEGDDQERLLAALNTPAAVYLRPLVLLAVETGMRRGELLSLLWSNVDLKARTAHLPMTKNGHPRTVALTPKAVSILTTLPRSDKRVFPVTGTAVRQAWDRLRRRAGVEGLRIHDLRHEAVSRLFELGLSVPEVALMSGHRDTRQLFRYTHLRPEALAEKLAKLG